MFTKLNQNFDTVPYDITSTGVGFLKDGKGIQYYDISTDKTSFFSVVPERVRSEFCLHLMHINCDIPPHIDDKIRATVNFYIRTEDCSTNYYKVNALAATHQVENQTNGVIFDEKDLTFVDGFVAKPGEAWLLDVTLPHGVRPNPNFSERLAFSLSTGTFSYSEVKELLKETGFIC
jgi:hypothetical protein